MTEEDRKAWDELFKRYNITVPTVDTPSENTTYAPSSEYKPYSEYQSSPTPQSVFPTPVSETVIPSGTPVSITTPTENPAVSPAETVVQNTPQNVVPNVTQDAVPNPAQSFGENFTEEEVVPDNSKRSEIRKDYKHKVFKTFAKDLSIIVVAALIMSVIIKSLVLQPFIVPSGSMEDTLKPGDRILVSKVALVTGVNRGDVVVFHDTKNWMKQATTPRNDASPFDHVLKFIGLAPEDDDEFLVKRVIGVGGDHIVCKGANSPITINGHDISNEPYIKSGASDSDRAFDVTVPDGMLWVMGDNRPRSADSRLNTDKPGHGFIDKGDVVGKVFAIIWPQERLTWLTDQTGTFEGVPGGNGQ